MKIEDLLDNNSWKKFLKNEFKKAYFLNLNALLEEEYKMHKVYPPINDIFKALNSTTLENLKVVILGQDPYHGFNQANGLSFSVNNGVSLPPSLKNIFKELHSDLKIPLPSSGNLQKWAEQGVLLLNTTLTVRESSPGSHVIMGWEEFTDAIIKLISKKREDIVFLLWGKAAEKKTQFINTKKHHLLISSHPSPFSANKGFIGSKHFSKTNAILLQKDRIPIDWRID